MVHPGPTRISGHSVSPTVGDNIKCYGHHQQPSGPEDPRKEERSHEEAVEANRYMLANSLKPE